MTNVFKKMAGVMLVATLAVCAMSATAFADSSWTDDDGVHHENRIVSTEGNAYYGISLWGYWYDDNYDSHEYTYTNVKCSNKKVAKIAVDTDDSNVSIIPTGKTGTATITATRKLDTGETSAVTLAKLRYVKYANVFSTFKIGSTNLNVTGQAKSRPAAFIKKSSKAQKLNVKTTSAFKIVSMKYKGKKIKNGKKYKFNKRESQVEITIKHKKTGAECVVSVFVF